MFALIFSHKLTYSLYRAAGKRKCAHVGRPCRVSVMGDVSIMGDVSVTDDIEG